MQKRRLLWIGDACVSSGFARATHHILDAVKDTWDVHVLGLNYYGHPHPYPYKVYPCTDMFCRDLLGVEQLKVLLPQLRPDLIVIQNDPWHIPGYLAVIKDSAPTIAVVAVDGKNVQAGPLNGLDCAVFWTEFGKEEARAGGYGGPAEVIPLGVDLDVYQRQDRETALRSHFKDRHVETLRDAYIVGNVNRNQPRKRFDLTIEYFAEWVKSFGVKNAYLYLHTAPTGEYGYDARQLMSYYGLANRLILGQPSIGQGISERELALTYSLFNAQVSTTQGEGFGLTTFEGMACGVPQIVPDWSALGELCRDAAWLVPCSSHAVTIFGPNIIGGIADKESFVEGLQQLYGQKPIRNELITAGTERVGEVRFRWQHIGQRYADLFGAVVR